MNNNNSQAPKILFTALRSFALFSSRLALMRSLQERGVNVVAASTEDDYFYKLQKFGIDCKSIPFVRGGLKLRADLQACKKLRRVIREVQPDLVHCFQPKPLLFTALAGGLEYNTKLVATMTGLGEVCDLLEKPILSYAVKSLFNLALRKCDKIIFQNPDDQSFLQHKDVTEAERGTLILGSGIDLGRFTVSHQNIQAKPIRVLMVSRILWNKGVGEYVDAARLCSRETKNVVFELGGERDELHKQAVPSSWIDKQRDAVRWIGYIGDMSQKLQDVDILVLPSYREGVPRVMLEGAASGIPLITTDAPGCRETVKNGKTGILVPSKDAKSLAKAIMELIQSPTLRSDMGIAGRKFIEDKFDIKKVINKHLELYASLGLKTEGNF